MHSSDRGGAGPVIRPLSQGLQKPPTLEHATERTLICLSNRPPSSYGGQFPTGENGGTCLSGGRWEEGTPPRRGLARAVRLTCKVL